MVSEDDLDGFGYYEQSKPMKPPKSVIGMVQEFVKVTGQVPSAELSVKLIDEEYLEWQEEFFNYIDELDDYNPVKELKELSDLVYVIYGYANVRGWDLDEGLRRVHQNNVGRCVQPDGTVQRRGDGKIMKNKDYPKVDLGDLV